MNQVTSGIPTLELGRAGQSPWLDTISRELLTSGRLKTLINEGGLLGVTSNPSIFEKAINQSAGSYEKAIRRLIRQGASTFEIYDDLTVEDIRTACDLFSPVFRASHGEHGFVSLEVIPSLAYDTKRTYEEAVRLFKKVNRPNVMIKVPATAEGIPAIRQLIGDGINVNITLIFSLKQYRAVAHAYLDGLNDFRKKGGDLSKLHSVASVFVSRIDGLLDKKISQKLEKETDSVRAAVLKNLLGKAALANSKIIYREFETIFGSESFKRLKSQGAWHQKVLWGSTSTKNPNFPDLYYVENLIGTETVNTMPQNTLEAFMDHGSVRPGSVKEGVQEAFQTAEILRGLGFDLDDVGEFLQKDGAKQFCDSFDVLMASIERIVQASRFTGKSKRTKIQSPDIPASFLAGVEKKNLVSRLFQERDPSIWKTEETHQKVILNRLGWLQSPEWLLGRLYELDLFSEELRKEKIQSIVLLGMGGSSLAPEVMSEICPAAKNGRRRFFVLDTTDAASILAVEKQINLSRTLFVVASKSGGTIETVSQYRYFYDRVEKRLPKASAGDHFIAITDSGSWLETHAKEKKFRKIFVNPGDIGGRFSALSYFGLVPAALIGLPVQKILAQTLGFLTEARQDDIRQNQTFFLGWALGCWASQGRNQLRLVFSPKLKTFAYWLEQLIAESTGKEKKGIVPIAGESFREASSRFGKKDIVVAVRLKSEKISVTPVKVFRRAGIPVVEFIWQNPEAIGAEFLRWELMTSLACAAMGVNPFDEPNVKESKEKTSSVLETLKAKGKLPYPAEVLTLKTGKLKPVYGDLKADSLLKNFVQKAKQRQYIAVLAYGERDLRREKALSAFAEKLGRQWRLPVLTGFGPRYLHSIGQLYKGGPQAGSFIFLVSKSAKDAKVPESHFSFEELKTAQALGDFEAITEKGSPAVIFQIAEPISSAVQILQKNFC